MIVVLVAVIVPAALSLVAIDRWDRARRTRRHLVDALASVPELAGVTPGGAADTAGTLAAAVARRIGVEERDVVRVADAARPWPTCPRRPSRGRWLPPGPLPR